MVVISQRRRPISVWFVDVVEVSKALSQRETVAKVTETRARLIPRALKQKAAHFLAYLTLHTNG